MSKKIFTFLFVLAASVGMSWATTTDLASISNNYTAQDGEILTGTLGVNVKISIADGATVTLLNANINGDKTWTTGEYAGLTCLGDATITIVGTNSVRGFSTDNGYPGIYVPSGKTLIINGTGSLTAQSSTEEAAGIGAGRNTHCGNIVIQSGKITAKAGGEEGAGIGGGFNADCGNITISGGIVTAVGGYRGAGIGGGRRSSSTNAGHCGNILISGGVVSATSGEQAAAIGGGRGNNNNYKTNCGTITITNTALKVYADQGGGSTNTIGAGKYGNCGTVTIGGNTGVINADPYTYRTKEDGEIVVDYINAIGTVVYTQECKDKIDIARELYDALEDDSQKDLVTNYQTLLDAEAAYAALIPYTVALEDGTVNADKVTLSATSAVEGATITVTPDEEYEITAFSAYYVVVEDQLGSIYEIDATLDPGTGAYSFTMPAANVTIEATIAEKAAPTPVVLADCELSWKNVPEGGVVGTIGHEDEIQLPYFTASLDFLLALDAGTVSLRLGSTDESVLTVYGLNNFVVNGVGECDVYIVHDEDAVFAYDSAAFHVTVGAFYIVGTMNGWTPNPAYRLAVNPSNSSEYMFIGLSLTTTDQFKVVYSANGTATTTWYPDGMGNNYGENGEIAYNGTYDIYFRPDGQGGIDWYYNVFYVAANTYEISMTDGADNSALIGNLNTKKANVTLNGRTLYKDGNWNTLCLPFAMTAEQVTAQLAPSALMTLSSTSLDGNTLTMTFADATTIEAGKPYIIKWAEADDLVNPVFSGVTISNAVVNIETTNADFKGNYAPVVYETVNKNVLFLGAGDMFYWPDGTEPTTVNAFRGYFELKGIEAGTGAPALRIVSNLNGENGATGIENLREEGKAVKFIENGVLYILRDGVRYDVMGKIVSNH